MGCLGPEERSLGILDFLLAANQLETALLTQVLPEKASRFYDVTQRRLKERRDALADLKSVADAPKMDLFATDEDIVSLVDSFIASASAHVVLDISALPKRFFFPFLKRLLRSGKVETIVATYTIPEYYGSGDLAEDHQPFTDLPLFGSAKFPPPKPQIVIVSAGFMKLGLSDLLDPHKSVKIRTILPFPPGPPAYNRNWDFIRDIEKALPEGLPAPIRVEAYDCCDAFDHIAQLCGSGARPALLAPFGPKPISLAMALYASLTGDIVRYTQPAVYHPFYSSGISFVDGRLNSYAYVIRTNSIDKYR